MLSQEEKESFVKWGFVKIDALIPNEVVDPIREAVLDRLRRHGFWGEEGWEAPADAEAEKKLRQAGIRYPDYLFGLHQSGGLDERYVLGLLPQLRDGVTELYCHPSFLPCPEVQRWTPTYRRDAELDALTSAAVREAIATQAIQLVNYRDFSALET